MEKTLDIPTEVMLPKRFCEKAREVVRTKPYDCTGPGGEFGVWFMKNLALKSQIIRGEEFNTDSLSSLLNEYFIGNSLAEEGFKVPKMYGVVPHEGDLPAILVMEKLNIIQNSREMTHDELALVAKKYAEYYSSAKMLGYQPIDSRFMHNMGFNRTEKEVYLFDFAEWIKND
jgi:hypothetical protein